MNTKKQYFIPKNEEHIEKLCDDLMTWAYNTKIPILADFMSKEMIPWSVLRDLVENNQTVEFSFELAITFLVIKWYEKAEEGKLSKAMTRLLSKYIEAYDMHLFYVDMKKRKTMSDKLMSIFESKNWSMSDIPDPFKTMYDQNDAKG